MDIREKVRLQYQALLTGDVALAVATTAPDWANDEAEGEPPACRIPGPAGLLATGAWMRAAFSDLRFVEHVSRGRRAPRAVGDHPERQAHRPVHGLRGRKARPGAAADRPGVRRTAVPPAPAAGRRDRGPLGGARRPRHAHPDRRVPAGSTAAGAHAGLADHRPGGAGGPGGDRPARRPRPRRCDAHRSSGSRCEVRSGGDRPSARRPCPGAPRPAPTRARAGR